MEQNEKRKKKLKNKDRTNKLNRRMKFVGAIITLGILGLIFRMGYITHIYGADFERYAVMQMIARRSNIERSIPPAHGGILDRNRHPLVDNERIYDVFMDVTLLHENPSRKQGTLYALNQVLGVQEGEFYNFFETDQYGDLLRPGNWRLVTRQISAYKALELTEFMAEEGVRHIYLYPRALRRFPDPFLAPQVVGFVRGDAAWGLEHMYHSEMAGDPGRIFRSFQSDAAPIEDVPARDGHWLVTTIDSQIQRVAQRVVNDAAARFQAEFTSITIMNPNTGEILGMSQWPSFPLDAPDDGTRFTDPIAANFWDELSESEQNHHWQRTWQNFAISRSFEPGSTFKPIVMAAALEEGLISFETSRFYCNGVRTIADWDIPCHNRNGHGSLSLQEALQVSCNIAMFDIIQVLGRDTFYRYRNDFGFGDFTGVDLPGEACVSSPLVMYTLNRLNPVELATSSMGQGFNSTAIQMLNASAALINGGYIMRPYVVSQIIDAQGNVVNETQPSVVRNILSHRTSDTMRQAMHSVVSPYGTGRRAVIPGYSIGGKTGTGEQRGRDWVVTSFVAYMPVENPQFIAMAIVYNPYNTSLTAGASAAYMIREVFEEIIRYRQLPPVGAEQVTGILDFGGDMMPDFRGMELRDVTSTLNSMGVDYQISGRGARIAHHIPAAGQTVPRGTPVFLTLDGDISNLDDLTFVPRVEGIPKERAMEMISMAGLEPVVVIPGVGGSTVNEDEQPNDEDEEVVMLVYRQFPGAGEHIQRGTQIRIRVQARE